MSDPTNPPNPNRVTLRVADVDRERVADMLRQNYSEGRLTYAEFQERLEQAYASRTFGDLDVVTADLPVTVAAPARPNRQSVRRQRTRNHVITYVTIMLFLIVIWALTGHHYFWPIWPIIGWGIGVVLDVLGVRTHHDRGRRRRYR